MDSKHFSKNATSGASNKNKPNNPVKQVVDVMKKVDTKGPEAKQNEVSIKDSKGKRINLNEMEFDYFKGTFVKKKK